MHAIIISMVGFYLYEIEGLGCLNVAKEIDNWEAENDNWIVVSFDYKVLVQH